VLWEGVPANSGLLLQKRRFVKRVLELCRAHGALLIFDEVITGFRLGPLGAAGLYGVTPDLMTFGKVIGGGLPVGCYGGRAALMEKVAPSGPVYQAGTLSGNPVAMAAGRAALETLAGESEKAPRTAFDPAAPTGWGKLEERARALVRALRPVLRRAPGPLRLLRLGSIFWLVFQDRPPRSWGAVEREGAERYRRFHRACLERGVYLPPSAFEVFFVSTAHDDDAIAKTAAAFDEALRA
jgi:glutamate-1-semialdehyde 2,1-aminomutase